MRKSSRLIQIAALTAMMTFASFAVSAEELIIESATMEVQEEPEASVLEEEILLESVAEALAEESSAVFSLEETELTSAFEMETAVEAYIETEVSMDLETVWEETEEIVENLGLSQSSDRLFEQFADAQMSGSRAALYATNYAGASLDATNRSVYDFLKAQIAAVADNGGSTKFVVPGNVLNTSVTVNGDYSKLSADEKNAVKAQLKGSFNLSEIFNALTLDCIYELYWSSGTIKSSYSYSINKKNVGGQVVSVVSLSKTVVSFPVDAKYQTDEYTVSGKVSRVQTAMANANAILAKGTTMSDNDKLRYYADAISGLTTYAKDTNNSDASHMISVFDGDPATPSVCEGYSKAFKYLCDQTAWSSNITCYTVTGHINVDEPHMWNIVSVDGQSYMVDAANYSLLSAANRDVLFMNYGAGDANGYTFTSNGCAYTFAYDSYATSMYPASLLMLAQKSSVAEQSFEAAYAVAEVPLPFKDVKAGTELESAVRFAMGRSITSGTGVDTFSPNAPVTRAQMVTFLYRLSGSPDVTVTDRFTDMPGNKEVQKAISWAVAKGITSGTSENTFSPSATCTRAQMVTFLYRMTGSPDVKVTNKFSDMPGNAAVQKAISWAVSYGITSGTSDTTFTPSKTCTRAQAVIFINRLVESGLVQ